MYIFLHGIYIDDKIYVVNSTSRYIWMEDFDMAVLWSGKRLRLRDAGLEDLDYIMELQADPENSKYISAFPRDMQEAILAGQTGTRDLIAESIETGKRYGYAMVNGADDTLFRTAEWTHIVVTKKAQRYGHELMRLLKAWTFEGLRFHRAWLDCKEYNARALHLYESEGMVREGIEREAVQTDGVYEDLIVLSILDHEYEARKQDGLEL